MKNKKLFKKQTSGMKIYLIPGLGFDCRIFKNLTLNEFDLTKIEWMEPIKEESIKDYAKRLANKIIEDEPAKVVLIGHSFGGIMSQEIATIIKVDLIILLSSIKSRKELPFYFKGIAPVKLHYLFTRKFVAKTFPLWKNKHDYSTKEHQDLFLDMMLKHSNEYLQWALNQISIWQEPSLPSSTKVVHIHGDSDSTFPQKYIQQPVKSIKSGGHFMVYKHPEEISAIIREAISNA